MVTWTPLFWEMTLQKSPPASCDPEIHFPKQSTTTSSNHNWTLISNYFGGFLDMLEGLATFLRFLKKTNYFEKKTNN